jgi:uncharacterized protein YndB with AHSA1/START domain
MNAAADDTTVVIARLFDAPPTRVFGAWVNREAFQSWIGPEGMTLAVPLLEARVGGRYRVIMRFADGRELPVGGEYKRIEAPVALEMSWGAESDPSRQSMIKLEFAEAQGKTKLSLRQIGLPSVASRDVHQRGWSGTLNKLAVYLAGHG